MNTNLLFRWFRRETAFFWVGMFIIPIFWIWWSLHPRFRQWERALAMKWTAVWITFMWIQFDQLPDYFDAAALALPFWCMIIGLCLWMMFICRCLDFTSLLLIVFPLGQPLSLITRIVPDHPIVALVWLILAVACNLLLNSTRRLLRLFELRLQRRLNSWWQE